MAKASRYVLEARRSEPDVRGSQLQIGGNKLFLAAGQKVADSLFTGASSKSECDLNDRVESVFNLSFWAKEGAFDW